MESDANALSQFLAQQAFACVLVLCRCGAAVMLLPGFGEEELPVLLRVGMALALTALLLPLVGPALPALPSQPVLLLPTVAGELLAGGLLGWLARLLSLALPIAGQIISLHTGLSSVLVPDATLGAQSAAIGRLFGLAAPVFILASGLYALPLSALAGSYALFPPGGLAGDALPSGDLLDVAVRAVGGCFSLAVRLAAPFTLVSVVWQLALGLLCRLVPQLQIYFAALPGQVLGGVLLLALLGRAMLGAWSQTMHDGFAQLPGS